MSAFFILLFLSPGTDAKEPVQWVFFLSNLEVTVLPGLGDETHF